MDRHGNSPTDHPRAKRSRESGDAPDRNTELATTDDGNVRTGQVVRGNRWDELEIPALGSWTPNLSITVVLPYYQAPEALERTLAGLARQTYPADLVQIVVADDGSEPPLSLPATHRGLDVTVVSQADHGFGLARARNTGAAAADGEILVFLDCDMIPEPHHLEAHARWHHACDHAVSLGFREHVDITGITADDVDTAARAGGLAPLFTGRPRSHPVWLERHMERMRELTADQDDLFRATTGGNLGLRAERFHAGGGFDETFDQWGSEDTDIGHRLFLAGALLVPDRLAACWHQGDSRGLETHERRSLEQQRARISQTVPHPGFRRVAAGRSFTIPRILVHLADEGATHATITATVESVLASRLHDVEVLLELSAEHPERVRLEREWSGDARVQAHERAHHARTPYRLELPMGTLLQPAALDAVVAALTDEHEPTGVLEIDLGRTAPWAALAVSTRALARARLTDATGTPDDQLEEAGRLFGRRCLTGAELGLRWAPATRLPRLRRPDLRELRREIARSGHQSTAGPWLLLDSPLGWLTRGAVGELLTEADQRVTEAEQATAQARYEAQLARHQLQRLKDRKSVRVATEVAGTASGQAVRSLPSRLRAATEPRRPPPPPAPPPKPAPTTTARHAGRALEDRGLLPLRPDRVPPFPHLRVLHLGAAGRFVGLAPHTAVDPERWRDQLRTGADLVLLEPPADTPDWDPLDGELPDLLRACAELDIPSVRLATDAAWGGPGDSTLELAEGPAVSRPGALDQDHHLLPSIDTSIFNPSGWQHQPPDPVVALLGRRPDDLGRDLLAGLDPPVVVLHPPDLADDPVRDGITRQVASPSEIKRAMVRAGVLLDHPAWRCGATETLRTWMAALACGTPIVVVDAHAADTGELRLPDGSVLELLPGMLAARDSEATQAVHRLLVDADLRERYGIVGRRWALREGSREAALRRILGHLDIPLPAPPRTTVLLATNRPDFLERGLASVARQTQPGVDVSLVLHGSAFDGIYPPDRDGLVSSVVRAPDDWLLGDCLNAAVDRARGELVAKMDDDDHYGPEHLRDLVTAWEFSGADLVGKRVEYVHLVERGITLRRPTSRPERLRPHVGGPTLLGSRETLRRHRFLRVPNRVDSTLYERVLADGGRIYGIHSRDLVLERHGQGHAWTADDEDFLASAIEVRDGFALDLATSDPITGT